MADETEIGSAGASDGGRHPPGGGEFDSPLQARAAFLKNWGWQSVISINCGACARGGALHGINSETGAACATEWQALHVQALTFGETLDLLRSFHRKAPFLFLNGNTFASIGRELTIALTGDLSAGRKREFMSAVGHYIAGVLDREPMAQIIASLCESVSFQPGTPVKTMRGSLQGQILRLLEDGRVVWQPYDTAAELIAMPESLVREAK